MRWLRGRIAALAIAAVWTGFACGRGDEPPARTPSDPEIPTEAAAREEAPPPTASSVDRAQREAGEIFATRCATCHGPKGAGDGPVGVVLDPRPRDFRDPAWQASVSDEHVERIILHGGVAVGKSPAMPPNPDLTSKPEVVAALRARVRSLASD
jgi:mono/diheme cytochrome c family protein